MSALDPTDPSSELRQGLDYVVHGERGAPLKVPSDASPPIPPPPDRSDEAIQEAARRARLRARRGRAATILTSGRGILGAADVARKILYGR